MFQSFSVLRKTASAWNTPLIHLSIVVSPSERRTYLSKLALHYKMRGSELRIKIYKIKEYTLSHLYTKQNSPLFISFSEGVQIIGLCLGRVIPNSPRACRQVTSPLVLPCTSPSLTSPGNRNSVNSPMSRRVSASLCETPRDD